MLVKFSHIDWDTSDDECDDDDVPVLPKEVTVQVDDNTNVDLEGADILSDQFGFCVNSFSWDHV
jgi:hypothetical protein